MRHLLKVNLHTATHPAQLSLTRIIALCLLLVWPGLAHAAAYTVTIHWTNTKQTIDGFGVCGGGDITPLLYNCPEPQRGQILDLAFSPTQGIGLSILRVAVQGGHRHGVAVPGNALEPSPGFWNHADQEQVWLIHEAVSRGVSKVIASVWSPPAWMKTNQSVFSGSLDKAHYQDFANYLSHYAKEFAIANGVYLYALSLTNEPDNGGPEWATCTWTSGQIADFLANYLSPTFTANGITAKVIVPEASNWDRVGSFMKDTYANPAAAARVDIVAGHLYGGDPSKLYHQALERGMRIWQTEASLRFPANTFEGALDWARTIHQSLVDAQCSAWIWWVLSCDAPSSLVSMDDEKTGAHTASKTLWSLGNYSRFIRPGYVRLEATANPIANFFVSAFKDPVSGQYVIVAVNTGTEACQAEFIASGFDGGDATPYMTSRSQNLEQMDPVLLSGTQTVPAQSVVTYVGRSIPPNGSKRF